ncbi:MAG: threonine synthase [Oscillospiraceae bacterium]|nr:threonine synthase [Oscillospiraceae bacterium]
MDYQSTRGALFADEAEAILRGIAADGGLFVDPTLGERPFDWRHCLTLSPLEMQSMLLHHLLPGIPDMDALVRRAYSGKFETEDLTPLVSVGGDYVLELFRGPTAAFKDVALSMLPQLVAAAKEMRRDRSETVVLTATSGDTGKAALEGFRDVAGTRIFVFFPHGGVSAVQRAQMVTQEGGNVTVCAVRGNFDDCQTGVKHAFAALAGDGELRAKDLELTSANSINIGRLAPQLVYYFIAYARLAERGRIRVGDAVDYVVPTGNFGDILAGWMAKRLGLPVGKLVCASNANRVLTDFFESGVYDRRRGFFRTDSPSMDILVSSNLERLLFYVSGGNAALVRRCMDELSHSGLYRFPEELMGRLRAEFAAFCCTDAEGAEEIGRLWRAEGYLCDPHTAVAVRAAREYRGKSGSDAPLVILSTASPYKFPAAVLNAIGGAAQGDEFDQMDALARLSGVPVPRGLASLRGKPERHGDVIGVGEIPAYIKNKLSEDK